MPKVKMSKEWHAEYYKRNKEKLIKRQREWYSNNKQASLAANREWRKKNPEKDMNRRFINLYGISYSEYNEIFLSQNGNCKICGINQSMLKKRLSVDHSHTTGKIRGLLCAKCNSAIGLLSDDAEVISRAAAYIKENS